LTEDFELTVARENNTPNTIDLEKALGAKYRIITRIGSGGFADVYLGEQLLLSRKVAIKILHAHYARQADLLKRFEREARSAASLSHPNIIDIYDVGESEGIHYIVMKFIDGETLNQRMHREGILPIPVSIQIIKQLAEALDYAHTNNVIHRDIKPANVMLDPYGRPMLMDFGVARVQVEGNLTKTGTVLGTPHYLPPEQPLGKPVDARSDIYSLGIMFYEMLSGQLPFHDENAVAVLFKHINEPPQPLSTMVADINPDLAALCHRMIEKDPVKRPQSAGEVAEVLHALSAMYPAPTPIAVRKSTGGISDNTEQLILLAREHVDQNKLDKALEIYTVVIQRNPTNTSAKMEISKILRVMFTRIQDHASKQEFDKAQSLIGSIKPMVHDNDRFENLRAMVDLEERLWSEKQGTMQAMDSDQVERMIDQEKARMEERRSVDIPPPPPVSQSIPPQSSISQTMIKTRPPLFRLAVLIGIGLILIGATLFLFRPKAQTVGEDTQGINLLRRLVQLKKPEPQAPTQPVLGQLSVTSEPAGATVMIGDEKKGVTPLQLADLPVGKYSLQVKLQGYEDFKQDVELTNEQSKLDVPVTLKAIDPSQIKGSVRIVSIPDGADVYLDGQVIGKTPFRWKNATPGDQNLVFKKDGYQDRSVTVSVIGNKTTSFETQLAEIPKVAEPVAPIEKPIAPGTLVELGPGVEPPKVVKRNIAEFSAVMKQLKREGIVKLNVLISENGKVLDVKVLESPHPVLEQAAVRIVKEWTYSPATKNGVPVRVWFPTAINFKKGTG
jgi:TonB family protein